MYSDDKIVRKRKNIPGNEGNKRKLASRKQEHDASSWSLMKINFYLLLSMLFLFGVYIAILPSPIDPRSFQPSTPLPYLDGVLKPDGRLKNVKKIGQDNLLAPESMAVDKEGNIYTGLEDGRIVKIDKDEVITNIVQTGNCSQNGIDGICGRPLGLSFDKDKANLIICDIKLGLLKLDMKTLELSTLVPKFKDIGGIPLRFINHVTVSSTNIVYFTESSWKWEGDDWPLAFLEGGRHGRLFSYDMKTGEVQVLVKGILLANGVELSPNEDFVLVSETAGNRIIRFYLKGDRKGDYDIFAENLPGYPDNIRLAVNGGYWVAMALVRRWPFSFQDFVAPYPFLRNIMAKIISQQYLGIFRDSFRKPYGLILKLDDNGDIIESYHDQDGSTIYAISEIYEDAVNNILYLGSYMNPFLGKLQLDN